ncbi:MAG: D-alanyl-D-alanine carboxypeptidase family protein [Methyloceanibacter sp.]
METDCTRSRRAADGKGNSSTKISCQADFLGYAIMLLGLLLFSPASRAAPTYASIVYDVDKAVVLHEANADARTQPASLTKIMTLYMVFAALDTDRLTLTQRLPVSAHAARMQPTRLGLRKRQTIGVRDAILALITHSANDAAVLLAEAVGKTESHFAHRMNREARRLGMLDTSFRNASGLPDRRQHTTARDMLRLGVALLRRFPHYYRLFSTARFSFNGRTYRNHNRLLGRYLGADGIKTGYVRASGFNLVASATRNGHRLVGVVLGGKSAAWRDKHMSGLLDVGFTALARPRAPPPAASAVILTPAALSEGSPQQNLGAVAPCPALGCVAPR